MSIIFWIATVGWVGEGGGAVLVVNMTKNKTILHTKYSNVFDNV